MRYHWLAVSAGLGACAPAPSVAPDPLGLDLTPQGRSVRVELAVPAQIAVYEMTPGAPLIRISPDTSLPVDHLELTRPFGLSRVPQMDFAIPTIRVSSWGGYATLLGETTGRWDRAVVSWEERPTAVVVPDRPRTIWLFAWLDEPLTPAVDSLATAIRGRPIFRAVDAAQELSQVLGIPQKRIRLLPVN